jgi:glycosyltransferase involved in cell wall biosynthesis
MHDPCCHNALRQANRMTLEDYLHFLGNRYEVSLADLLGRETHRAVQEVVDRGILGVRGITSLGVARFVVNSRQAAELVRKDAAAPGLDIAVLYHPVFDREAGIDDLRARRQTGEEYVVGSFGGANRGKMTDVVVEAVQRLRAQGDKVRLVLAGYEARRFVRLNFGSTPEWITVSEPATERELQSEMAKCDLAIQLRHRNLGESSGVVPMLIGMGIPTVVSPIGAFLDYGDAVVRFGGDDPAELAALIASHPTVPQRRMATFAAEHGLDKFEEAVRHAALGAPAQDAVRRVAG